MSDLPQPKPGLLNRMTDYTEEEVRRVQSRGFMPDDEDINQELYAVGRKLSGISNDVEQQQHSASSDDTEKSRPQQPTGAPCPGAKGPPASGPPPGGPGGPPPPPIAGVKVSIFHPAVSGLRWKVFWAFMKVYGILIILVLASFSLYWGSLYNRTGNMHRLKMLVVIEDDAITGVTPTIGDSMKEIIQTTYKAQGNWKIIQGTEEINSFFDNPENVTASILKQVHHRNYWAATYVRSNATLNQFDFLKGDVDSAGVAVQYLYETGRDPVSMTPYVVTTLKNIAGTFNTEYYGNISQQLISQLSDDDKLTLIQSTAITTPPLFQYFDYRPFSNYVLMAPVQVGLIFLIITSFLLFNFFAPLHMIILPHIKIQHYLVYRVLSNHFSYLFISLFIAAVSAAFQIDFTLAFGKGGFVVFWLSTYLTMAAVGGANENMGLFIFAHNPPFFGIWLISFVIVNVAPAFNPLALVSPFYRYGYMFPIHHSNEIYKVIFFGLYKGDLGMNYGVLTAWVVINTLLMPIILRHVGTVMANRARAAAIAAAEAKK